MTQRKDPAAVSLGRKGGKARAKRLSPEERSEIARAAVQARWDKQTPEERSASAKKAAATRKRNKQHK